MKRTNLWLVILISILLAGCSSSKETANPNPLQRTVVATFFPLYDLAKDILGDRGAVSSLVKPGTEPHDFEPNPSDIERLSQADAFVTMGVEFAPFEDKLIAALPRTVAIIPAGKSIQQIKATDAQETLPGGMDPHIWLSPKNAKIMVVNILEGISVLDPANAAEYKSNAEKVTKELDALDSEFKKGLANCKKDIILVTHNAFSYLAREYGFKTIYISGLEPEGEPTPQQLVELIKQARDNDIKYVFYEELVDPRVARTIAEEVHARALELSPLEGSSDPKQTYFTLMRSNLKNLEVALECQ